MQEIREELERKLTKPIGVEQFLKVPLAAQPEPVKLDPVPHNRPHPSGLNRRQRRALEKASR